MLILIDHDYSLVVGVVVSERFTNVVTMSNDERAKVSMLRKVKDQGTLERP
jgi:hypothetical protein